MATVNLYFDNRATAENEGVIKIVITHNREKRRYTTGIKISDDQWEKLPKKGEKLDGKIKDPNRIKLYNDIYGMPNGFYRRAESIIEKLGANFDFDTFKDFYDNWGIEKKVEAEKTDVLSTLSAKSETLLKNGQVSHGTNFGALGKSLQRFIHTLTKSECKEYGLTVGNARNPQPLKLEYRHITPDFLKHYEEWMLHEGKAPQSPKSKPAGVSITTVSIYTRALRTLFNEAIEAGIIKQESYPFSTRKGSSKYSIPESENIKKALSRNDIDKIKSYLPEPDSFEQRAHDLWLFSYYGNGMNVADICRLKRSNLTTDYLHFERTKTKASNKKPLIISVKLRDEMRQIIERHGHTDKNKSAYLFPFLVKCKDSKQEKQAIHQVIKMTNKYMKRIGEKLGIEGDLNTYAARHSFATTLQRTGAPISFIQGKLGHKKSTTTETYLKGFEPEQESEYLSAL
ncbi:MAG: site-specific integrase [Bacteroidetes bacterium]|nr:site-specific integrase [Bacteroidota bacterium]